MDLSGAFQCIMHSLFPHAQIICDRFHYIRLVGQNFIHSRFDAYSFIRYQLYDGRKLSNGPIEERNRIVKIILRLANGYTNFNRFRNRVLYVLNKYETYSEKILDVHKIRKTGTLKKKK